MCSSDLVKELEKKYNLILLGHQHGFQKLGKSSYHLGSIRYVTFNELEDEDKYICLLKDGVVDFTKLKSVIPMKEVFDSKDLNTLSPRTKVRFTIKNFEQFKREVNNIAKWKDKFIKFKLKLDFKSTASVKDKVSDTINLTQIVNKWLDTIQDNEVKKELLEVFE